MTFGTVSESPRGLFLNSPKLKRIHYTNMKQRKRHIRTFEKLEITHLWEFIMIYDSNY